jgi:hypothetical protein
MLLANLARHRRDWHRPLASWQPAGDTDLEQQSSLIRHLLARYEVPAFMEQAWYTAELGEAREHRGWYLHLARGGNIRRCATPIQLTHRAAHLFLQAPKDCTIVGAMRRAQYLAMGGSCRGAAELLNTALGYAQPDEPFWETALLYFANHESELRAGQIALLTEYLHWRITGDRQHRNPLMHEPVFTMKGRSLGNILREAEAYRAARPALSGPARWWDRTGIQEWEPAIDAQLREWSIVELLSSAELRHEGEVMRHCVAHYDRLCISGAVSIWSVRYKNADMAFEQPIMTLELRNERREVVQARGKFNCSAMSVEATPMLRSAASVVIEWADREKLSLNWGLLGWNSSLRNADPGEAE